MTGRGAVPGLFFNFAAMVLLTFVSVSAPTWNLVYFLDSGVNRYGVFGYTGSGISVGYQFQNIDPKLNRWTASFILHPIAAGLSFIAVLFGLYGLRGHRIGTVFMVLVSLLAGAAAIIVWIIDIVIFLMARNLYGHPPSELGNALWLTLGAAVALAIAFIVGAVGMFGHYDSTRKRYWTPTK